MATLDQLDSASTELQVYDKPPVTHSLPIVYLPCKGPRFSGLLALS